MANTVFKLRRSSVAGKQPNTSTLAIGELALNLTDRKLYSSDGTNVWETGANLTTLAVSTNTNVNNVIFSGGIYANGFIGAAGQVLTSNSSGVYWSSSSGGGGVVPMRQQYTGDGSTTVFSVTGGYTANSISVFLNGVLLLLTWAASFGDVCIGFGGCGGGESLARFICMDWGNCLARLEYFSFEFDTFLRIS